MCYIQNKDFKATLKSEEEAESFIKAVIGVSAIRFKSYIFTFENCYFFLLRMCYLFFFLEGGGYFFFKTIFYSIVQCLPVLKMTSKVSFDQRQTTMSQEMFTLEQKVMEINPKSNQSDSAVNDFNSRIVIARDISLI